MDMLLLFSCPVMSNSLQPHGLQHAKPPCPSTSEVCPSSCPLHRWCHPTVSSSVVPFSSCLQSSPASGSFQMSQFLAIAFSRNLLGRSTCPSELGGRGLGHAGSQTRFLLGGKTRSIYKSECVCVLSGQRIGISVSKSILPINTQDWSPLGWTSWIAL